MPLMGSARPRPASTQLILPCDTTSLILWHYWMNFVNAYVNITVKQIKSVLKVYELEIKRYNLYDIKIIHEK
jgi:hypothetical protein